MRIGLGVPITAAPRPQGAAPPPPAPGTTYFFFLADDDVGSIVDINDYLPQTSLKSYAELVRSMEEEWTAADRSTYLYVFGQNPGNPYGADACTVFSFTALGVSDGGWGMATAASSDGPWATLMTLSEMRAWIEAQSDFGGELNAGGNGFFGGVDDPNRRFSTPWALAKAARDDLIANSGYPTDTHVQYEPEGGYCQLYVYSSLNGRESWTTTKLSDASGSFDSYLTWADYWANWAGVGGGVTPLTQL